MDIIYLIPAMAVSALVSLLFTRNYYRKAIRRMYIEKPTGKFVLYKYSASYDNAKMDVEEICGAGGQTKVRVIKIYNTDSSKCNEYLKKINAIDHIAWVATQDITWYDNSSQIMRDKKIQDIIGEN